MEALGRGRDQRVVGWGETRLWRLGSERVQVRVALWCPAFGAELTQTVGPLPQEKVSRLEAELDEEKSTVELLTDRMNRGRDQVTPS